MAVRKIGLVSMLMLTLLMGLLWSFSLVGTRGTVEVEPVGDPSWNVNVQDASAEELRAAE